jgi:hypothetical protein
LISGFEQSIIHPLAFFSHISHICVYFISFSFLCVCSKNYPQWSVSASLSFDIYDEINLQINRQTHTQLWGRMAVEILTALTLSLAHKKRILSFVVFYIFFRHTKACAFRSRLPFSTSSRDSWWRSTEKSLLFKWRKCVWLWEHNMKTQRPCEENEHWWKGKTLSERSFVSFRERFSPMRSGILRESASSLYLFRREQQQTHSDGNFLSWMIYAQLYVIQYENECVCVCWCVPVLS